MTWSSTPSTNVWSVKQMKDTYVYDRYSAPSKEHPLGTDTNGMDMLTRLMYGGRVSLIIGFIVVAIEASLGILLGGISGYFGGWVDGLIMRIVDVFYCIPSMPIIIIIGSAMDAMKVDSWTRMVYLMLILGFLGLAGHCPSGARPDPPRCASRSSCWRRRPAASASGTASSGTSFRTSSRS